MKPFPGMIGGLALSAGHASGVMAENPTMGVAVRIGGIP